MFSLQTVPAREEEPRKGIAQYAGFSLHGGIGVEADQREKLERLTRYVSRAAVALERLALTAQGQVRYRLKTVSRRNDAHRARAVGLHRPVGGRLTLGALLHIVLHVLQSQHVQDDYSARAPQ
jgi:hypothetical protein